MYEHKDYSCTDVFALGMIIYFMFTGKRPYADDINEQIPGLPAPQSREKFIIIINVSSTWDYRRERLFDRLS